MSLTIRLFWLPFLPLLLAYGSLAIVLMALTELVLLPVQLIKSK
jgi:hypothetical protein